MLNLLDDWVKKTPWRFPLPLGKTILFSGIDGSGRTKHARKLTYELRSNGICVKNLWMRGRGRIFFSFPLLILCRLLQITKVHKLENGITISEYPFYAYKPIRLLWPWLQFVDSLFYTIIFLYRPFSRSRALVLIDRNVIDTLVDIVADTRTPIGYHLLQMLLLALLPKNSFVVVLDVSEDVAMSRKKDILNLHYLKIRIENYRRLAKKYGWYLLSTDDDYNHVHKLLLATVSKTLKLDNLNETNQERGSAYSSVNRTKVFL